MKADGPQSCSIWERKHAILMNTSPAVMHDNYIRYGMTEENKETLEAANLLGVRVRVLSKHYGGIFPPLPLFTAHDLTRFLLK
jgi:hypothetical protein